MNMETRQPGKQKFEYQGSGETSYKKSPDEYQYNCPAHEKDYFVVYFIDLHPGRTVVFCNCVISVRRLTYLLNFLGYTTFSLHAFQSLEEKNKDLAAFKENDNSVLVTTDVTAGKVKLPEVNHILHYQLPRSDTNYLHRLIRTAPNSLDVLVLDAAQAQKFLKTFRKYKKKIIVPHYKVEEYLYKFIKSKVDDARSLVDKEMRPHDNEGKSPIKIFKHVVDEVEKLSEDIKDVANQLSVSAAEHKHTIEDLLSGKIPKNYKEETEEIEIFNEPSLEEDINELRQKILENQDDIRFIKILEEARDIRASKECSDITVQREDNVDSCSNVNNL